MIRVDLPAGVSPAVFAAELIAAIPALAPTRADVGADGVIPELVHKVELGDRFVLVPESEEAAARAVLAAPANEATLRDRADAALANLQAAYDGWGGLTAANKDAALKLNVRVTIALARLVLRKLDST